MAYFMLVVLEFITHSIGWYWWLWLYKMPRRTWIRLWYLQYI